MPSDIERVLDKADLPASFDVTRGDCVEIALAMREVFGGTVVAVAVDPSRNEISHAALRHNGTLFDGRGHVTTHQLCTEFIGPNAHPDNHIWEPDDLSIYEGLPTYEAAKEALKEAQDSIA